MIENLFVVNFGSGIRITVSKGCFIKYVQEALSVRVTATQIENIATEVTKAMLT